MHPVPSSAAPPSALTRLCVARRLTPCLWHADQQRPAARVPGRHLASGRPDRLPLRAHGRFLLTIAVLSALLARLAPLTRHCTIDACSCEQYRPAIEMARLQLLGSTTGYAKVEQATRETSFNRSLAISSSATFLFAVEVEREGMFQSLSRDYLFCNILKGLSMCLYSLLVSIAQSRLPLLQLLGSCALGAAYEGLFQSLSRDYLFCNGEEAYRYLSNFYQGFNRSVAISSSATARIRRIM